MKTPTFRKAALNALSSPEELNKILVVTKPSGWIALMGFVITVIAVFLWGVFGSIPTIVEARGIIVREGGLQNITALGSGSVRRITVNENDMVRAGDTIAFIDVPDVAIRLENANAAVREADSVLRRVFTSVAEATSLRAVTAKNQKNARSYKLQGAQQRVDNLERQALATKELLDKGLVTSSEYLSAREQVLVAQQDLISIRTTELQETSQDNQLSYQNQQELIRAEAQLTSAMRTAKEIELQYKMSHVVTSTSSGRITQLSIATGSIVNPGTTIAMVESTYLSLDSNTKKSEIAVAVFVPPALGKKVARGMTINVVPTNIEAAEYGSIVSTAFYISDYPLDAAGIKRFISNEALLSYFGLTQEPPIGIVAFLTKDASNPSGYKWTSGRGPDVQISTGSICNCSIVVDEQPPIALLLPWLKKTLGLTNG